MQIDQSAAEALFASLPASYRLATLHPRYVAADAARTTGIEPRFWAYRENDALWYHGFHLCPLPGVPGYDIQSPYGYGGPICNTDNAGFLSRAWQAYKAWLREVDVAAEFLRFHPLLDNAVNYGGECHDDRDTVWVDLARQDLLASYAVRARTAVRKAEKQGMQFVWRRFSEADCSRFTAFYHAGMQAIGAAPFYFFQPDYFAAFAATNHDTNSVWLGTCERDGEWLAAGLFLAGGDTLEYHLAATSEVGKKIGATNMLLHGAGSHAQQQGILRFYLGGGTDARPDNPLFFFKQGFSPLRARFRIGRAIHDAVRYDALKRAWPERWTANPGKILFYR
jgi:hypothetical protein